MVYKHAWKVDLVPWDHMSAEQVERLYDQRVACGWRAEEVPEYVEAAKQGNKIFYWVILSDDFPDRQQLLDIHFKRYPKEATPLRDTATTVRGVRRKPTDGQIFPIGHIALAIHEPESDAKLGLTSEGVVWMHQLYISYALQRGGLGRAAVEQSELVASQAPMNGTVMVLDTLTAETQLRPDVRVAMYDDRGIPQPEVTNEDWYLRLGYEIFGTEPKGYRWNPSPNVFMDFDIIYMRKSI